MSGAKRKCDWMDEERRNHFDGEKGTCVCKLGTAAQRDGSQSAYQLTITDVFLPHSEAQARTYVQDKWFSVGITFNFAISLF